jgi:hypothetical protein
MGGIQVEKVVDGIQVEKVVVVSQSKSNNG